MKRTAMNLPRGLGKTGQARQKLDELGADYIEISAHQIEAVSASGKRQKIALKLRTGDGPSQPNTMRMFCDVMTKAREGDADAKDGSAK